MSGEFANFAFCFEPPAAICVVINLIHSMQGPKIAVMSYEFLPIM
jgi:hypothetical protein